MPLPHLAYSPNGLSQASGLPRTAIFDAIRCGKLKARKHGRRTLITPDDARAFIDAMPLRQPRHATEKK